MMPVQVSNQAQLLQAMENNLSIIYVDGGDSLTVSDSGSSDIRVLGGEFTLLGQARATAEAGHVSASGYAYVDARDASSVDADENSTVRATGRARVEAFSSARVFLGYDASAILRNRSRAIATDDSKVRADNDALVIAYDRAMVVANDRTKVYAYGTSVIHAHDLSMVSADRFVTVYRHSRHAQIFGGNVIDVTVEEDARAWCERNGVPVVDGRVMLVKATNDNFRTGHQYDRITIYIPGATVTCSDWDSEPRCGGGLHVSPRADLAASYRFGDYKKRAIRYLRVSADLADIVPIDRTKCKARTLRVEHEVDEFGDPISTDGEPE